MYSRTPFACIGDFRPIDSVQQLESPAMLSLLRVKPDQRSANPQTAYARRAADDPDTAKQKLAAEARLNATKERIFIVSKALIMLFLYMLLGTLVFHELEKSQGWTYVDAAYFSMATMSTVGYGDISPTPNASSRGFTLFMIFFGIIFVFTEVASAIGSLTSPITLKGRQFMEYLFPQIPVDLDGDGGVDYYKPRPPLIYYTKNLLPSFILTFAMQFISAGIFCALNQDWDFGTAIYHCLVTATTVGYGDASNSTQGGRVWACFHIVLSVCLLGELISTFDELKTRRKDTLARVEYLGRVLDEELLDQLLTRAKIMRPLVVRDGKGLTELEFVLAMIVELGVVQWDQVQPFIKQFRSLDVNGDARLGIDDLNLIKGKTREEINAMIAANPPAPMSVASRMGVTYRRDHNNANPGQGAEELSKVVESLSIEQLEELSTLVGKQLKVKRSKISEVEVSVVVAQ